MTDRASKQNNSSLFPAIPGYRIEKELGQGGMARVYLAHEEKLERLVALKILKKSLTEEEGLTVRFLKEAKVSASLRHSGIVTIHDVGSIGDLYYFTMEYLEHSLKERIHGGFLPPREALVMIRQLALALDYAHRKGFIHRDIKPDNIMFREDGTPVLTDFGIARAIGSTTKLTKTGMSIGTPHYMSPEQARGKTLDGRSDLYSLGIVFYEMLTGRVPYEAEDSIAIAVKHIQEPIPELPSYLSQYQPLLNKLLAKDPADRFQSGSELVSELESQLGRAEASAAPTNPESRIPNPGFSDQPASFTTTTGQEGRRSKVEGQSASSGDYAGSGGSRFMGHDSHPPTTPVPKRKTGPQTRLVQKSDYSAVDRARLMKRNLTIGLVSFVVFLAVILIALFVSERAKVASEKEEARKRDYYAWNDARNDNTAQSYQKYLNQYPYGEYAENAREQKSHREIIERAERKKHQEAARELAAQQERHRKEAGKHEEADSQKRLDNLQHKQVEELYYAIQVRAFSSLYNAKHSTEIYKNKGYTTEIVESRFGEGIIYRVWVGHYSTRIQALEEKNKLEKMDKKKYSLVSNR